MPIWAIATREPADLAERFRDEFGIELPILLDRDGAAFDAYQTTFAFPTGAYPQQFVVGVDGTIVYYGNTLQYETLVDVIEEELAKVEE